MKSVYVSGIFIKNPSEEIFHHFLQVHIGKVLVGDLDFLVKVLWGDRYRHQRKNKTQRQLNP